MKRKEQLLQRYLDNTITIDELIDKVAELEKIEQQVIREVKIRNCKEEMTLNTPFKCTREDIERLVKVEIELKELLLSEHIVKGTFIHNEVLKSLNMLSAEINILVDRMHSTSQSN